MTTFEAADRADIFVPHNMKEYDPEWGRAFWTGTVATGCDHARMLASVRTPVLLTHHYREIDAETGSLMGAISEEQVRRVGELVTAAGQPFELVDVPDAAHAMHRHDPELFARTIAGWEVEGRSAVERTGMAR